MPIEIRSIDSMDVKLEDIDYLKLSPWCFGACLTENEKSLIKDKKAAYLIPTKNMGVLSCKGVGGVHNVSFIGSDDGNLSEDSMVWQFDIFAHKDAEVDLVAGDSIVLEMGGKKITD
jgi:hypothetical protein